MGGEAVIIAVTEWIEDQDQNFFCEGIKHCSKDGTVCWCPRELC